jgi:hypothetical protein
MVKGDLLDCHADHAGRRFAGREQLELKSVAGQKKKNGPGPTCFCLNRAPPVRPSSAIKAARQR